MDGSDDGHDAQDADAPDDAPQVITVSGGLRLPPMTAGSPDE